MQHEQAISVIEKVLTQLRPMIHNDGGDIQLVKYENNIAYVKLLGACVQCPISQITLKLGVEDALKLELPELKEVVAVE
jgi:Fe-S cluster biogenesis protein NfuA